MKLTYVYNVSDMVQHDIAIVSIFELENKSDDRICGHGLYEISPRTLEFLSRLISPSFDEIFVESDVSLATHLVQRFRVRHALNYSTLKENFQGCYDLVSKIFSCKTYHEVSKKEVSKSTSLGWEKSCHSPTKTDLLTFEIK